MHHWLAYCSGFMLVLAVVPLPISGQGDANDGKLSAKELSALLEKARAKHDVPAMAAGIVRGGDKPRLAVTGVRKRGVAAKVTIDDTWHLGSNSKPVTALLIAILVDLGLLDWDTPLEQIFPEQAGKWKGDLKKITVAHLLTHTSGLPELGPVRQFMATPSKKAPQQDRAQVVKDLTGVELAAAPGEKYAYSNLGYVVLGAIADRRGKAPWEEQFKKRICQPLGIKHWALGTTYPGAAPLQPYPHQADGQPIPTTGVIDNPAVMNCTGRIRFSIGDYGLLLSETLKLARGETGLLKPATARKMFTVPYPASNHMLAGWSSNRRPAGKGLMLGHEGSNVLNYCTVVFAVDDNFVVCVMANQGAPGGGPGQKACLELREELGRRERK